MNDLTPWLIAIFSSKLLLYIAYAMSVGGMSGILLIQRHKPGYLPFLSYVTWGVILGLLFSSIDFLLQVGSFAESGLTGMWDQTYVEILWQSGAGMSYKLRLVGWSGLLILLIVLRFNSVLTKPIALFYFATSLIIATSFTAVGHTAEQVMWVRLALILHIFVAMWWVGSLYPLRFWCQKYPTNTLRLLMHEFGKQASFLVVMLLVAGVGIAYILEGGINNLINSSHGNILLLKIGLVAVILSLATLHKCRLVPALISNDSSRVLQRSISIEMGVAFIILVVTAMLSTLVGPTHS